MQAAAAHKLEQQRLEEEMRRLRGDKAILLTQAQRVPGLEEQLKATSLAKAETSQVGQHIQHVLESYLAALAFALLSLFEFILQHSTFCYTTLSLPKCNVVCPLVSVISCWISCRLFMD